MLVLSLQCQLHATLPWSRSHLLQHHAWRRHQVFELPPVCFLEQLGVGLACGQRGRQGRGRQR